MRCVLAIVWNQNREIAKTLYEMSEAEVAKKLTDELSSLVATTWWQRLKAVFRPMAAPNFSFAVAKVFQDFKNQTIAAHQAKTPDDRPHIDWKLVEKFRGI